MNSTISFICNICGNAVTCPTERVTRENPTCPVCKSSVRTRSIVHLVSMTIFGRSLILKDFPARSDIVGIGLSDWDGYAKLLAQKFNYTNTFYHQEPRLDITSPGSRFLDCDFIISSDVFEHVHPPAQRAFVGAAKLLKKGGALILTVPFTNAATTVEHFSEFSEFQLVRFARQNVVVGVRRDGSVGFKDKLVFHGGAGETLEMRVFCRRDLETMLFEAGFSSVQFVEDSWPEIGIIQRDSWSLPIIARRK